MLIARNLNIEELVLTSSLFMSWGTPLPPSPPTGLPEGAEEKASEEADKKTGEEADKKTGEEGRQEDRRKGRQETGEGAGEEAGEGAGEEADTGGAPDFLHSFSSLWHTTFRGDVMPKDSQIDNKEARAHKDKGQNLQPDENQNQSRNAKKQSNRPVHDK